jgi:hypothetical protein
MSALTDDEYSTINHALSHASAFHGSEAFRIQLAIEGTLLTVAIGVLSDPAEVAARCLRDQYVRALEICDCTHEHALRATAGGTSNAG